MDNALCGPQVNYPLSLNLTYANLMVQKVPGTIQPDGPVSNWTNLNPCPLNACCDIWGQCGITPEFCTSSPADTGNPGTARRGTNGCISNCGTKITNNNEPVLSPRRIGYFEAWNKQRECLNMDISKLDNNGYYSAVHWAFANITTDWKVDVSGQQEQFDGMLKLTLIDKVLSFGGWGFSTSGYTYSILRSGVKDGNRQIFAKNVVDFITKYNLDGVDFDWEYPGAQDIRGVPPDSPDSGANYLEFLKLVRQQLPSGKTLSIAAPASYWYLRNFPIKEISEVVDYIVYMTYDLHGQWDYDKPTAASGCPAGGCLRSQVNKTETAYALSMITKAGVPAKQIIMGLPLYGRSFKLAEAGCTGPNCHFTGPLSGATLGVCTNTAGYISNYEIFTWLSQDQNSDIYGNISISQYEDEGDVVIFNETDWISWLSPESYVARREWGDSLNFGGTSDWAVDLNQTYASNGTGSEVDSGYDDDYQLCDYSWTYDSLEELSSAATDMRTDCVAFYTLKVLIKMLDTAYDNFTNVNNGYDEMFTYYVEYMNDLVPQILYTKLMFVGDGGNPAGTELVGAMPVFGEGMNYFDCTFPDGKNYPCGEFSSRTDSYFDFPANGAATRLTLTDSDGWSAKLTDEGIDSSYVEFGDHTRKQYYTGPRGNREYDYNFNNFPIQNTSMVVPNPKDIVSQVIPNIPNLRSQMKATLLDIMLGQWINGSISNAAEAYSSPVFMLMQGVNGMAQAKQIGEDEKNLKGQEAESKKRNFILTIVSVVLIFVPIIGEEAAAAAGLATLARSCAIAGEAGNVGLAIYDTVQNPQSAFVNIIGSLIGVGSIAKVARDGPGLDSVARIRQGMKATEISNLGKIFKSNSDTLDTIMKVCRIK
ncbi:uncharacterized protein N7498_008875 [Penicillium cinerascens]|uniref:chitinase n=1 Tax=Penicillium cinerascens TaxID=70096 RepID=A0A9W9JFP1_9EURO|nr:uncharacterized protein N7498_008875 [Penicillium cinerascens]KAJ5195437.1 hypothetical protein N7498_008875 [Penicillium cinerascens]